MSRTKVCQPISYRYGDHEERRELVREINENIRRVREIRASRFQATASDLFGTADCAEAKELVANMYVHTEGLR